MTSKLRLIALGSILALSLTSCASNLPSGAMEENSAFSLLGNGPDNAETSSDHKKNRGKKGKHHGMMFKMMTRDLDLTADQKTALQALMKEGVKDRSEMKGQLKAFKAKVQTAFVSDRFDAAALQTDWEAIKKPEAGTAQLKMAEKLKAAWAILTPEQQTKIEDRLSKIESRMVDRQSKVGDNKVGHQDKKLAHMAKQLNLTEAQKTTLKSRWEAKVSDRGSRYTLMKGVKQAVLTQLKAGASSAEIAQSMAPLADAMEGKSNTYLTRLAELHEVLTAEQRQLLMNSMKKRSHHGRGHHKP